MKAFFHAILMVAFLTLSAGACAEDRATADEAVAMVHKVIAQMKARGKDAVIADINNFSAEFKDRDLYVTVQDMNGVELAHGANKRMQGVNLIDVKDSDGKLYIRERMEIVKTKGKGWQDYNFVNPVTKAMEPKSMYFEKYENLIICSGIYKPK